MSAVVSPNPPTASESRSARKKKAKAEAEAKASSAGASTPTVEDGSVAHEAHTNGADGKDYESPYIKELYKNIRNVNKKITAASKVEALVAEHPGQSLDQLISARKINNDQKAQVLKKPSLQASLAQLEEQIAQYKKFDHEYQQRLDAEKAALKAAHKEEKIALEKAKEEVRDEATAAANTRHDANLLILSKFLRAAAAKRMDEANAGLPENKAFEGLLLMVYAGDETAVEAMNKLFYESDDRVMYTDGEEVLDFTFAQVKQASMSYNAIPPPQEESSDAYLPSPPLEPSDSVPVTDPTVAHASLTEINEAPVVNGTAEEAPPPYAPQQTGIDSGAANAAAESHWDSKMSTSIEGPEGWVKVARDPSEIETGPAATTAAASGTQSWADDQPTVEAEPATSLPRTSSANANSNDGFHEDVATTTASIAEASEAVVGTEEIEERVEATEGVEVIEGIAARPATPDFAVVDEDVAVVAEKPHVVRNNPKLPIASANDFPESSKPGKFVD
ncbi:MAG: hypothetical protein M1824_002733 [Vezdaea acicularis]|nr:MAG: hypothetical protein M1824_002733 [Vezdaea acicularis]